MNSLLHGRTEFDEPDSRTVFVCEMCGGSIYEGDDYYFLDERYVCQGCLEDWAQLYKYTAEYDG